MILSSNDVNIIREVRNRPVLYGQIAENPKRFFDALCKKKI